MSYKDAIAEAMASAPADQVILDTIELYHPAFTDELQLPTAIRLVKDYKDYSLRLEADAILDAGTYVQFLACSFDVVLPEVAEENNPTLQLSVGNVSREITAQMEKTRNSLIPIKVTYRPYLASDPTGPQLDPPIVMELSNVDIDVFVATGTCSLTDIHNKAFPSAKYTTDRFPGLKR